MSDLVQQSVPFRRERKDYRRVAKEWLGPRALQLGRRVRNFMRPATLEYLPDGWPQDSGTLGWDDPSIVEAQRERWLAYLHLLQNTQAFAYNPEGDTRLDTAPDLIAHNMLISYAYAAALAAEGRTHISVLDWGGGAGQYGALTEAALPNTSVEYHCHDRPQLCELGRSVYSKGRFLSDADSFLDRKYDLVVASGSLQCFYDWEGIVRKLATFTSRYLYITRLHITTSKTFAFLQRPWRNGYETTYPSWIINRDQLISVASASGLELAREFYLAERLWIRHAPADNEMWGFLFKVR